MPHHTIVRGIDVWLEGVKIGIGALEDGIIEYINTKQPTGRLLSVSSFSISISAPYARVSCDPTRFGDSVADFHLLFVKHPFGSGAG